MQYTRFKLRKKNKKFSNILLHQLPLGTNARRKISTSSQKLNAKNIITRFSPVYRVLFFPRQFAAEARAQIVCFLCDFGTGNEWASVLPTAERRTLSAEHLSTGEPLAAALLPNRIKHARGRKHPLPHPLTAAFFAFVVCCWRNRLSPIAIVVVHFSWCLCICFRFSQRVIVLAVGWTAVAFGSC